MYLGYIRVVFLADEVALVDDLVRRARGAERLLVGPGSYCSPCHDIPSHAKAQQGWSGLGLGLAMCGLGWAGMV